MAMLLQVEAYKAPPVIGVIDSVRDGKISGWACQKHISASIDIHVYAREYAGKSGQIFVTSAKANHPSEHAVANACGTNFKTYRYEIQLSPYMRKKFRNMTVFLYGIKLSGNIPNSQLHNSGGFRIDPTPVGTGPTRNI